MKKLTPNPPSTAVNQKRFSSSLTQSINAHLLLNPRTPNPDSAPPSAALQSATDLPSPQE